jgi:hypothetical protein
MTMLMEQDPQVQAGVDDAVCRNGTHRPCVRIVLGWSSLLGGLAAWIASDVLYQALPRSSVTEVVLWVAAWQSFAVAAMVMLWITVWWVITQQVRRVGMNLFWTIQSLPELKDLPPDERSRVFQACQSRCLREWRSWGGWIMIILTGGILSYYTITMRIEPHGLILTGLVGGVTGGAIGHLGMHRTRCHLRDYLNRSRFCVSGDAANIGQPQSPPSADQPGG